MAGNPRIINIQDNIIDCVRRKVVHFIFPFILIFHGRQPLEQT